jgi:gliding motility-associated lipoprotein GldD
MMTKISSIAFLFLSFGVFFACKDNDRPIPKPPTYLKLNLPEKNYINYSDDCGYSFQLPDFITARKVGNTCNRDFDLGSLNGMLHLSYIKMDTTLAAYINYAIDKVDEHKIKATAILDTNFINKENRTYGTFFELQGNVASPFQFYLTDSNTVFMSGVIYFNTRPNFDSIRPVLNYLKKDLYKLMETAKWPE